MPLTLKLRIKPASREVIWSIQINCQKLSRYHALEHKTSRQLLMAWENPQLLATHLWIGPCPWDLADGTWWTSWWVSEGRMNLQLSVTLERQPNGLMIYLYFLVHEFIHKATKYVLSPVTVLGSESLGHQQSGELVVYTLLIRWVLNQQP